MENVIFALGGNDSFFFNAPKRWARGNLPSQVEQLFKDNKVSDVRFACLGADPNNKYAFSIVDKAGQTTFYFSNLPKALNEYLKDEKGNCAKGDDLKVVLGPDDSFFAWDRTSMRWSNLPAGLESSLQGWLSPSGWLYGPPRVVALGKDGGYFALTEYGAWSYWMPASSPQTKRELDSAAALKMLEQVENIFLNPAVEDSFVLIFSDTHAYGNKTASFDHFHSIASSFASPEVARIYEREKEERQRTEEAEQKRKAEADDAERKRKVREAAEQRAQQQKAEKARRELEAQYRTWKAGCDKLFRPGAAPIVDFPHLPIEVCTCEIAACWSRKTEKLLFACRHDVERWLRASGQYSLVWLRTERLAWHPDRFGRKCSLEMRPALSLKATEMYAIFEELIAAELGT